MNYRIIPIFALLSTVFSVLSAQDELPAAPLASDEVTQRILEVYEAACKKQRREFPCDFASLHEVLLCANKGEAEKNLFAITTTVYGNRSEFEMPESLLGREKELLKGLA